MKIACIGGGPAGLYFALLMKKRNRAHQVTADDEREVDGRAEHSRPDVGVHRVHGGGEHVHQDVGRAGAGRGQLAVPDDVGGTELPDVRGTHRVPCCHRGPAQGAPGRRIDR